MSGKIARVEASANVNAFCVIYRSGREDYYCRRDVPKTVLDFMLNATAHTWEHPITKEKMVIFQ